ncbi:uncharacterized protein F4807DRAFT_431756 [Annulohypoxylon truncatum]|uniref:uncharacterized protein n=1 Tax=Annulohypoxylon truncatum TaxID=327061 RepID=UPI0020072EEC|nr:uncharacterized protein F4807DRAFT_431756 [Annulohypoxylon truncatum]KAI1208144.1 hypothetical protein F4807DRAFT_431756 [Annulohypoxylon truncatum]
MSSFYGLNLSTPLEDLIPPPTEINNAHKKYSIAIASIVMGILTTLVALVRLTTRFSSRTLGPDDYAIIPAIILYIAWIALAAYSNLDTGIGKPLWEITVAEYGKWYQCIIAALFLYPAMSASVRVSIILLYRRVFSKSSRYRDILLDVLLGFQGVYVIIFSIMPGFVCTPIQNAQYPLQHTQFCHDVYYANMQTALFSASLAFDTILLVIPIFWVTKLQLPLKKRIGLVIIFVLGAGASIAAAYKLAVQVKETWHHVPQHLEWFNYLMSRFVPTQFESYGVTFWVPSVVEPTVALIGTSLPALQQLRIKTSQKLSSIRGSHENSQMSGDSKQKKTYFTSGSGGQGHGFYSINDSDIELRAAAA